MARDEFDLLLDRCRERLSEISLTVPALESGAPRRLQPVYSLTPPVDAPPKPIAPPKPAAPLALPAPAKPPEPPKPAAPPPPASEEREDDEVFPPLRVRPRTPPPSVPLWRAQPAPPPTPAPLPAPPRGGRIAAAAAAAVVAAGTFGVWLARRPAADLDIEVGGADAIALRPEKGDLLVAQGKELLDLTLDGRTIGRQPLDAEVEALRWDQGSIWSADGRTASIVEHAGGGRTTVFPLNHVPGALYVKEKYLWTAEKGGRVLHQFLISRSILGAILQPLDSFEVNGLSPETFTIDDAGTLWIVDQPSRRLYRLRLDNGSYKQISSAPLSPFVGPDGKLRSMTIENDAVWLLAQPAAGGSAALRRIRLSRLDWTPA